MKIVSELSHADYMRLLAETLEKGTAAELRRRAKVLDKGADLVDGGLSEARVPWATTGQRDKGLAKIAKGLALVYGEPKRDEN